MRIADDYKRLVETAESSINSSQLNVYDVSALESLYIHFQIELDPHFRSLDVVQKHLGEQMKANLEAAEQQNGISKPELQKLRKHLALQHFVGDLPSVGLMLPLEILLVWVNAIDQVVPGFEQEDVWLRTISLAKDYALVAAPLLKQGSLSVQQTYCREYAVSQGVTYFRERGYAIGIEDARPKVDEADLHRIATSIDEDVKALGGAWLVGTIFEINKERYDPDMQRFHFVRQYQNVPQVKNCTPSIPHRYLLNLAAKHCQQRPSLTRANDRQEALERLQEASRHFAALYDVQNYYQMTMPLQSSNTLVDFVQDTALYDSFFVPPQLRASDVPDLIERLFSWVDRRTIRAKLGFDIDSYVFVVRQILHLPNQLMKPTHFHRTKIKLPGGSRSTERDAILSLLSHEQANAGYLLPNDYAAETFSNRPLVRLPANDFGLLNASWCGAAFYEALFKKLIDIFGQFASDEVGDATEEAVKSYLRLHNVNYKTGEYSVGKARYECDVVVETPKFVIFIEVKKKPLTRNSRSGGKADLFIDLFKSLFDSQIQALRHRVHLTQEGQLTLSKGSKQHTVYRQDRRIVTISLTTLDYGGFQDKVFAQTFQKHVYGLHLSTDSQNKKYENAFRNINKKISFFRELYKQLMAVDLEEEKAMQGGQAFYDCPFMSLPQLLVMLDNVDDNKSFETSLLRTRSVTTLSQDYYYELAQLKNVEASSRSNA